MLDEPKPTPETGGFTTGGCDRRAGRRPGDRAHRAVPGVKRVVRAGRSRPRKAEADVDQPDAASER